MSHNVNSWEAVSQRDDVRALYADDASHAQQLPWEVRSALGNFFVDKPFSATNSQQKSSMVKAISAALNEQTGSVATEQWEQFIALKERDSNGNNRKRTNTSLYETVKKCIAAETKLLQSQCEIGDDAQQFLDSDSSGDNDDQVGLLLQLGQEADAMEEAFHVEYVAEQTVTPGIPAYAEAVLGRIAGLG